VRYGLASIVGFALLAPSPALSQESNAAADDLRCAAWAAAAIAQNDDAQVQTGLTAALLWFLGRYEVATGIPFEQALTPEYINGLGADLFAAEEGCRARIVAMAERMSEHGQILQQSGR
jgi:hypothetical protein